MNDSDELHHKEKPPAVRQSLLAHPSKDEIAALPPFEGLQLSHIHVLRSNAQVNFAARELMNARFVGFDTETKPVFTKDAVRDGPHVVQLATLEHAFIVQVGTAGTHEFLRSVIESDEIVKVGFGLKCDRGPLRKKLGLRLGEAVDLAPVVRRLGYSQAVGVKAAVAVVLGQRLVKSKSVTTSNWALPKLRPNQLKYAADDALAALRVFHAMGQPYAPRTLRS
jgi:ribonuclease D